jgi:hypothetical protein
MFLSKNEGKFLIEIGVETFLNELAKTYAHSRVHAKQDYGFLPKSTQKIEFSSLYYG